MVNVKLGDFLPVRGRRQELLPVGSTLVVTSEGLLVSGLANQAEVRAFEPSDGVVHKKYGAGVVARLSTRLAVEGGTGDTLVAFDNGNVVRKVNAADLTPEVPTEAVEFCGCGPEQV